MSVGNSIGNISYKKTKKGYINQLPDIFPALYINNTIVKNNEAAKQVIEEKKLSPKIEIGIKTIADIVPIIKGNIQSKIVKFLVLLE